VVSGIASSRRVQLGRGRHAPTKQQKAVLYGSYLRVRWGFGIEGRQPGVPLFSLNRGGPWQAASIPQGDGWSVCGLSLFFIAARTHCLNLPAWGIARNRRNREPMHVLDRKLTVGRSSCAENIYKSHHLSVTRERKGQNNVSGESPNLKKHDALGGLSS